MRSRISFSRLAPGLVAVLLFAACATGRGAGTAPQAEGVDKDAVEVQVRNNLTPRTDVMVRIFGASGARTFLGSVPPGQTRKFEFRESLFENAYHLVAEVQGDPMIESRQFELYRGAVLVWTLKTNVVDIRPR